MRELDLLVAILLCNAATTLSYSSNYYDASSHESGRINGERFNLLELLKNEGEEKEEDAAAGQRETTEPGYLVENWTGRWFPHRLSDPTPPPKVWPFGEHIASSMGKVNGCDDGKSNLEVDWDKSPVNYTCYGDKIVPDANTPPIAESVTIPPAYIAPHRCMNETIEYDEDLPVCGTHRPVWPVYGEYTFLPIQRWLHSLEHGAVVALYHPCANPLEVQRLKKIVKQCLRRHIITPYQRLDRQRPLALLARGSRLRMAYVDAEVVRDFIRARSLQAPENIPTDGQFDDGLASKAQLVSDFDDSAICPNM